MRQSILGLVISLQVSIVRGFAVSPLHYRAARHSRDSRLCSSPQQQQQDDEEQPKLVLDNVDAHMSQLRNKYPTSESDYLAAARARSAARIESKDRQASDQDWQAVAEEKKMQQEGLKDDWEASAAEAGNAESQIIIPMDASDENGDEEEPKLLLF
jgi:hypothetical protein